MTEAALGAGAPDRPVGPGNTNLEHLERKRRWWVWVLAALIFLIGLWFVLRNLDKPKPKAPPPPTPVAAAAATTGNMDVYLDALGTVTPVYTDTIVSRVAGMVTEVHFREGQIVKKNDLLAVVDPRPYTAALLQAQGQLDRDQALLRNARIDLARYQKSYADHAIPEQQLATQQALVEEDLGTVKLDQGNLDAAKVNVDYTRITSPIEGRVGLRNIDPGNVVTANGTTGLCVITQLTPITVIFVIAEDSIDQVSEQINAGHKLTVLALDRSKQHVLDSGTLLTLDNQVNTTTGTVRARATFPNVKNELFPSQFVNARLLVKTLTRVVLAPQAAIQRDNDAAFVYVIQPDNTVQSRNIEILATEGESSAVSGVSAGEQLVTDGFDKLQPGSKVVIRKSRAPEATAAAPADE